MKKALLLLVVLFVTVTANAQFDFCIGPKVGYQTLKLSTDKQIVKSEFSSNKTFGVFGRITIKKFFIQPELLYYKSGKVLNVNLFGEDFGLSNLNPTPTLTINQSNMAMPVFFGWQFVNIPLIKMRANFGPVFYFAVGETKCSTTLFGNETSVAVDSPVEEVTVGGAVGLGIDLWRFTLDVNYSLGLSDVIDDDLELHVPGNKEIPVKVNDDTRQNIFTVTLGFKIL